MNKGYIRPILALMVGLLLICGCGKKDDPSVLKLPETTAAAAQEAVQATPEPLTPLGDRVCAVGKETIPESPLFSFLLTELQQDPQQGLLLKLSFANKSTNRNFLVSLDALAVNGYMQDVTFAANVPAGQSGSGEIRVSDAALRTAGISSVDELILYPLIYDDSVPMGQGDVVDGAFSFYPTGQTAQTVIPPTRLKTAEEMTFFDNSFGALIVLGAQRDAAGDLAVNCYLENRTDRFLGYAWSDVTANGSPVNTDLDVSIAPGMRRYVTLTLPDGYLPGSVSEVGFTVTATPLSNAGLVVTPLVKQQGVYRIPSTSTAQQIPDATVNDPYSDPDEPEGEVVAATATPQPTTTIYTKPTSAQKKNAKKGHIIKTGVNMRSGPGTKYKLVAKDIEENTPVTLYELQDGWWFLKCGSKYGYIRSDMVRQGAAPKTPEPASDTSKSFAGEVKTQSKAALRQSPDTDGKFITEYSDGKKLTIYYKTKGKDGKTWYYASDGSHKGFIRSDLVRVKEKGKIPNK